MPTYAFVDQVAASPTILFDLDNQSPFSVVVGTQTPPPQKRFSASSSTARDGDNIAQSSYNDRVLTIALRVELNTTAEEQAEGIQKFNRLLDAPQWLMWQHDTMIEPVFFRTRRGDLSIDDNMMVDKPKRTLVLTIPAEPFAYGLPVTGTATIANDPTAATNPMSYILPDIQGDVATPLWLSGNGIDTCLLAVGSGSTQPLAPIFSQTVNLESGAGWSAASSTADSDAIGGTAWTTAKSSGSAAKLMGMTLPSVPLGDWRLLARVKVTSPVTVVARRSDLSATTAAPRTVPADGNYHWVDLGVARLPSAGRTSAAPGGVVAGAQNVDVSAIFTMAASTGTVSYDVLLPIPAGLDADVRSSLLLAGGVLGPLASATVIIDGLVRNAWTNQPNPFTSVPIAGGLPYLVPGSRSVLNLLRTVSTSFYDSKNQTTTLTYLYYPHYLYIRPATS